ncbi:hypothetical protein QNH47_10135 [Virgibacillus halodenitrificans]|uniref:hypothetical protein n=1 Tax=Virgibacillus halodenitrificans TaxID=1482 RepID=UPI0024C09F8F|nr:hypothetical protein [Virgibacillus halodenitrificans]WHX24558.1 hypothetical protein QNH47_10135 [Virgibacillus halodenitrificans]
MDDLLDRNIALLVIDTGCDVCDTDLIEFAEESLTYGHAYSFIPVISSRDSSPNTINIGEHNFRKILNINYINLTPPNF